MYTHAGLLDRSGSSRFAVAQQHAVPRVPAFLVSRLRWGRWASADGRDGKPLDECFAVPSTRLVILFQLDGATFDDANLVEERLIGPAQMRG